MNKSAISPKQAVIALMKGTIPEVVGEIDSLWRQYHPDVRLVTKPGRVTLNANQDRIEFDSKTMAVFWLIGFGGWKAIECYSSHVICSAASGDTVADLLKVDSNLSVFERAYKERLAAARTLINAADPDLAPWPPDLPRPNSNRDACEDSQYKVAYDLTCMAAAFTLLHEFRHVMLERDNSRPTDRREEELACDVWAREFMTSKLAAYAARHGHNYHEVLRKRSMGLALAALILHEITPVWDQGGNLCYFSIATRLQAILENTPLLENDHFWIFASSLLVGIFRQRNAVIDAPPASAHALAQHLIGKI